MRPAYDAEENLFVRDAAADARAAFLRRTYTHLFGAILGFIGLEAILFSVLDVGGLMAGMVNSPISALVILVGFMVAGWVARQWAFHATSLPMQYAGLALYTVAEAIFFAPLLWYAKTFAGPDVIPTAGFLTLAVFGFLTVVVLATGANFSFLRTGLMVASFTALGVVLAAMLFGFTLGLVFSAAMVLLACGFILYDTSEVLHNFHEDQYVAAALELFASVALLFWYVLRIIISLQQED